MVIKSHQKPDIFTPQVLSFGHSFQISGCHHSQWSHGHPGYQHECSWNKIQFKCYWLLTTHQAVLWFNIHFFFLSQHKLQSIMTVTIPSHCVNSPTGLTALKKISVVIVGWDIGPLGLQLVSEAHTRVEGLWDLFFTGQKKHSCHTPSVSLHHSALSICACLSWACLGGVTPKWCQGKQMGMLEKNQ